MSKDNLDNISDELLASFLDGNTSPKQTMRVINAMRKDKVLQETVVTSSRVDSLFDNNTSLYTVLPMERMAAQAENNLCDFECEKQILQTFNIPFDESELSQTATCNHWLKKEGTPLYQIGRLLEKYGLAVRRIYNNTVDDIANVINNDGQVIIIVNCERLKGYAKKETDPFHAIVLLNIDMQKSIAEVFDPASENCKDSYPLGILVEAWKETNFYCVEAYERKHQPKYHPQPIDSNDIELDTNLLDLREAIAENAHDIWASARIREGWTYGPQRNDTLKQTPDLVPYFDLPDSEKQYDRDLAMETIKLVKKLGYDFIKKNNSELYHILYRKLSHIDDVSCCSNCGAPIFREQLYCERCGKKIRWQDLT